MATKNRWETLGIPTMYLHVLCITTKMWGSIEAFCRATCSNSEVIFPEWWTSSEAQSHKIHQNPSPFMIVDVAFSPLPSLENGKCTESEFWKPQLGMDHNPSPHLWMVSNPHIFWAGNFSSFKQLSNSVFLLMLLTAAMAPMGTTLEARKQSSAFLGLSWLVGCVWLLGIWYGWGYLICAIIFCLAPCEYLYQ